MKVYVLTKYSFSEWDDSMDDEIIGVFSNEELAKIEEEKLRSNRPKRYNHSHIKEVEIDKL